MLLGNVKFRELDTIYILLICLVLIETTCLVSVLVLLESIFFHVILCWLRIEERDVHGSYSFMVGSHFMVVEFQVHFTGNPGSWLFRYPKKISRHEDIGLHKLPPSMLLLVSRLELIYVKTQPSSNCCILESVTTSEVAPSSNLYN